MKKVSLSISFFAAGFVSTSIQIVLIREFLTVLYGNELSFAIIYFFWFLSIGLGAYIASKVREKLNVGLLILSFMALFFLPPAQIYMIRSFKILTGFVAGEWVHFSYIFLASSITVPFGMIIGFIFPCMAELASKEIDSLSQRPTIIAGSVYSIESLGSTMAGLIVSLVCIKYLANFSIAMMTGAISLLTAFALLSMMPRDKRLLLSCFMIVSSLCLFLGKSLDEKSLALRWKSISGMEKMHETDSVYQNIAIGGYNDQYGIFGNGSYISSFPDEYGSRALAHFLMALHPKPQNVLLAAEGKEEMIPHMLKHHPLRIDLLQLDAKMHEEIVKYLPFGTADKLKDERVSLLFQDARKYLNDYPKCKCVPYDLMISLPPDPVTLNLNRYYTVEFFAKVRDSLDTQGVFVTSVTSTENYLFGDVGRYLGSVYKTLKAVFDDVKVIPGPKAYLVASRAKNSAFDLKELTGRFAERNIESDGFDERSLSLFFQEPRIESVENLLKKNLDIYTLNSDLKPAAFLLSLKVFSEYSGGLFERLLGLLMKTRFTHLIVILIALTLGSLFMMNRPKGLKLKFLALLSITTTGIISFALQILIIYFYQAQLGYIYQKMGLVIGLFMFGLFLGSFLGNRIVERMTARSPKALIFTELLFGVFLLILPFILIHAPSEIMTLIAALMTGLFTGIEFPLSNKIYFEQTDLVKAASKIDSLDHFGAALGAIGSGLILVPVLGIVMTCILLFSIKAGVLILWLTVLKRR